MKRTAIVTGGSSGIGAAAARALVNSGYSVYAISRHKPDIKAEAVTYISADVTNEAEIKLIFKEIAEAAGGIDLLVSCAGTGISGALEFIKAEEARRQLDVNFIGSYIAAKTVIPYMRAKGGGRIIFVSSVAAFAALPFQLFYSASKAAINSMVLALANELKRFNISVCSVLPGDTKTGFTAARLKEQEGDGLYGGAIGRSVSKMEKDEQNGGSPEVIGKYIGRLAGKKRVRYFYTIGLANKLIVFLGRFLPYRLSNWIIGLVYAS
jgi:NAD(P)-dependent dehydrogenase (short-subunit alcohol dehydrogenase family)